MYITNIVNKSNTKYRVYVDEQFAFVLNKSELLRYKIHIGREFSKEEYALINEKVILKRAKLRTMHLLADMDRTEKQLRDKLRRDEYTDEIIEQAIYYVKSFGYLDDSNYAERFVASKKNTKSKKEITLLMKSKGLSDEIISNAMDAVYDSSDSQEAIKLYIRKKNIDLNNCPIEKKQKLILALGRKGFSYEDIRRVVEVSEWNT